ncbi:MAG: cystathionine beta-lyase [Bacteroidetes bacterium]|nr:cystathionine beta-lyase [Bacteroidota bacterium]
MEIKIFLQSDPEYLLSLILRYKILRIPLGLTFSKADLERDTNDIHMGAFEGDTILGSLILTDSGDQSVQMRQVAVDDIYQGKGIGRKLALYSEAYAKEKGFKLMFCHARSVAAPFYQRLGYRKVGDEFVEVGIPHYHMEKTL